MAWIRFRSCPAGAILSAAATILVARATLADSGAAGASPTKTSSSKEDAKKAQAVKLHTLGMAAFAEGRDGDAVDLLWQAWELDKDRTHICNRAGILAAAGRDRDAAESYVLCQQAMLPNDAKMLGTTVERALLKVRKNIGTLSIGTSVDGAEVIVDGRSVGKSPLSGPVFVEPGDRSVIIRAPGYWENAKMVNSEAGSWITVYAELDRIDPDNDGSRVATTPTRYVPEVPAPVQKVEPKPAPPPRIAPKPEAPAVEPKPLAARSDSSAEKHRRTMLAVSVGLAAGGAVLGVGGLVFGTRSINIMTMLHESIRTDNGTQTGCTTANVGSECNAIDNVEQSSVAFLTLGAAGFVLSGVGTTLIGSHLGESKSSSGTVVPRVAFGATPTAGFAVVHGRF